jgi:hypothetical protein
VATLYEIVTLAAFETKVGVDYSARHPEFDDAFVEGVLSDAEILARTHGNNTYTSTASDDVKYAVFLMAKRMMENEQHARGLMPQTFTPWRQFVTPEIERMLLNVEDNVQGRVGH